MDTATTPVTQVDARGEVCPMPLMMVTKALKGAAPSAVVQVLIDHAPALDTIPPQAKRLGWQVQVEETGDPEWTITLSRP
ncbi:MAG: sulfurtransferase TusA family protein [Chloroflexi bacterium]|nr:sulfurtransferase TusA family protein [Chloroflexota bacterium]